MTLESFTRARCPELADFLAECCEAELSFAGEHPIEHSSHNHIHLWALEYWADTHAWIDTEYRVEFAETVLDRWKARLKGYAPYRDRGYRLYLYQDLAPTVSVVAETKYGFPYPNQPVFVHSVREIMELYADVSWRENFSAGGAAAELSREAVLDAIAKASGSISKPAANALGISVGALRVLIEQMYIADEVNALRKRFKRRPASFRSTEMAPHIFKIYEQRLPPGHK